MASILRKIASNTLTKVPSGESVNVQSLWEDSDVVIYFLRRFGCPVCRWISHNLSSMKPILDENNVKLVGIGPEENGSKQFYDDKIFDGDLFIDGNKQCYKDLKYGSLSILGAVGAAFDKQTRDLANKAKTEGLGGNFKGDFNQLGGLLIVKKGGEEILMDYKQVKASDYIENQKILDALGIQQKVAPNNESGPNCTSEVCSS